MAPMNITIDELHNILLEILDDFAQICGANNLTWFLTGGTLLGAVRHKGFIPWDDDVDVSMPRNDFEKLLNIFDNSSTSKYYIISSRSQSMSRDFYTKGYAKFCKNRTIFIEKATINQNEHTGFFIDVFPVDNCVRFFLPFQERLAKFCRTLYQFKTYAYTPNNWIKTSICHIISCFLPSRFILILISKIYTFFNKFNTKYATIFPGRYGHKRETHKKTIIFPLSTISFEGKEYPIPRNPDIFLTTVYGNYMEIPALEKRKIHSSILEKGE